MIIEFRMHDRPIKSWSVRASSPLHPPVQVPFKQIVTITTQNNLVCFCNTIRLKTDRYTPPLGPPVYCCWFLLFVNA